MEAYLGMSRLDQTLQVGGTSIVGVDGVQVLSPVAMVAIRFVCNSWSVIVEKVNYRNLDVLSTTGLIHMASKPMFLI